MIDIRPTLLARSDQLNADDLIGGPMTITITDVRLLEAADQPVAVHWEGGDGRPFKPCKSMRRVMAKVWGEDGKAFIGQRMTVYRDDKVRFGSDAVGGIRISHMSGIDRETTMALMVTRGKRAPYTVRPLAPAQSGQSAASIDLRAILADGRKAAGRGSAVLTEWWGELNRAEKAAAKPALDAELKAAAAKADQAALEDDEPDREITAAHDTETGEIIEADLPGHADEPEDDFPGDRPSTTQGRAVANNGGAEGGEFDLLGWGDEFGEWIAVQTSAALISKAWAEHKSTGRLPDLQRKDPDRWDALAQAKDERMDALRGAR